MVIWTIEEKNNYPPGPRLDGLIFKIFQIPDAEVIILSLHFSSQNKNTSVLVFLRILVKPVTTSPTLEAPINFKSNEIVTQGAFPDALWV